MDIPSQIQLSDSYTRNIVFGYIRDISRPFSFTIPSIIYELCVSFYYAGEHFAYLGYDMDIRSEDDNKSLKTYNNIVLMTSDANYNTCYGQVIIDTNLKINYIYEWIFQINTTYATSIGFGISTDYDKTDDAFWIGPNAKYYAFVASMNAYEKLSLLCSDSNKWITYNKSLSNNDKIKLIFNVKKKTLNCVINDNVDDNNIIVYNVETNRLKYHLSISMCGKYNIRLLDFQRIRVQNTEKKIKYENKNCEYFGQIQIGILTKSQKNNYYSHSDAEDDETDINKVNKQGDILTLKKIIKDYQLMKTNSSRKQLIHEYANKKMKIKEYKTIEEVYGLIELIILFVIRNKYKDNIIFTQTYFKDVSQFVEWIYYDENNMGSSSWDVNKFAQKFDDWIEKII